MKLDLSRDIIVSLDCPECGQSEPGRAPLGAVGERQAACPECRTHRIVQIASCVGRDGAVNLEQTPADMGIPPWDIMVARQGLEAHRAWLFDGDAVGVLGPLVDSRTSGPDEQP